MPVLLSSAPHLAPRDRWLVPVLASLFDAETVEALAADPGSSLWEAVLARGLLAEERLVAAVARHFRLPVADLSDVSAQALELIPERWARRFGVLPLGLDEHTLVIATANPCDVDCERALAFAAARPVRFAIGSASAIGARL